MFPAVLVALAIVIVAFAIVYVVGTIVTYSLLLRKNTSLYQPRHSRTPRPRRPEPPPHNRLRHPACPTVPIRPLTDALRWPVLLAMMCARLKSGDRSPV